MRPSSNATYVVRQALAVGGISLAAIASAGADTLDEALAHAYAYNTDLASARAHLRSVDEQVPQALAGWRPTVTLNPSAGPQIYNYGTGPLLPTAGIHYQQWNYGANLQAKQPLYTSGRTDADIARAEAAVRASRADLLGTEQTVLLQAATAYDDVQRARALAALDRDIEALLRRKLHEITIRMQAGQLTQTDIDQTASRVAAATASRIGADGDLAAANARFIAAVGRPPDATMAAHGLPPGLPKDSAEAIRLAEANSPTVIASLFRLDAAQHAIEVEHAALLPSVSLTAQAGADQGQSFPTVPTKYVSATINVTVPLYQGGAASSRLRQAKESASESRIETQTSRRDARKNADSAYAMWQASTDRLTQQTLQVRLAEAAYDGVRRKEEVGAASTFELLGQLQELFTARSNEVQARYDVATNAFQMLVAIGRFTGANLLPRMPLYDATAHYNDVRDKGSPLP